jgi:hypothetical protein
VLLDECDREEFGEENLMEAVIVKLCQEHTSSAIVASTEARIAAKTISAYPMGC